MINFSDELNKEFYDEQLDGKDYAILPSGSDEKFDYLNPCTADLKKLFKIKYNIDVNISSKKQTRQISLYSSEIIIPIITGASASIIAGVILMYIGKFISNDKNLQCKIVYKASKKGYKSIELKGSSSEVVKLLKKIEADDL
ncbi:hypothetical protein [Pectobacterium versatile]|uniref:hypothetical protein n=1 Tax=Enterobacterales TaxID=91347 RepID=UPI000D607B0F|nr:hypothetical protein [Pectobacterium versatile]PWD71009.1 hypothetical protein DF215_08400 [Pectobacterium versatile]